MLTLEGVMRTEFGEGLDLMAAADEASIEVVAPDRTLLLWRPDGARARDVGPACSQSGWRPPLIDRALDRSRSRGRRARPGPESDRSPSPGIATSPP